MKKFAFVMMVLCGIAFVACAFAADKMQQAAPTQAAAAPAPVKEEAPMALTGTLIDNMCAGAHSADMATFIVTHPKSCAIAPSCAASGYSIYANGKLMKFDKASSAKIAEFLMVPENTLAVEVTAKKAGDELSLVTIKNAVKK